MQGMGTGDGVAASGSSPWNVLLDPARPARARAGMLAGIAAIVVAQIAVAVYGAREPLLLLAALAYVAALILSLRSATFGLAIMILVQVRLLQGSEGIDFEEVAYAGIFFATIGGWLLRRGPTLAGRSILRSPLGRTILIFLGVCFASVVQTVVFKGSVEWWLRDLVRISYLLLFFPLADALQEKRSAVVLLTCFLAVITIHAIVAVSWYQASASAASLEQIQYLRAPFHEVFAMATLVGGFAVFLHARSRGAFVGSIVFSIIAALALAVSLTRGYWLWGALAMLIVAARSKRPGRVVGFGFMILACFVAAGFAAFGTRLIEIVGSLAQRATTISSPMRDMAVLERAAETAGWFRQIPESPVVGHGLGTYGSYMSPALGYRVTRTFAHNAYLFFLFKIGIVGLGAFLAFYGNGIRRAWRSSKIAVGIYEHAVLIAGASILITFLPLSVTSPQFYRRASVLVLVLILGYAQAVYERHRARGATR